MLHHQLLPQHSLHPAHLPLHQAGSTDLLFCLRRYLAMLSWMEQPPSLFWGWRCLWSWEGVPACAVIVHADRLREQAVDATYAADERGGGTIREETPPVREGTVLHHGCRRQSARSPHLGEGFLHEHIPSWSVDPSGIGMLVEPMDRDVHLLECRIRGQNQWEIHTRPHYPMIELHEEGQERRLPHYTSQGRFIQPASELWGRYQCVYKVCSLDGNNRGVWGVSMVEGRVAHQFATCSSSLARTFVIQSIPQGCQDTFDSAVYQP